jgi:hypothetical protein
MSAMPRSRRRAGWQSSIVPEQNVRRMTERSDRADRGYAICTSGRSGSNLLGQYLSSTGMLGNPLEYFNGAGRRMLGQPDYPDDPSRQID